MSELEMMDALARRYGHWPHEVLDLTPEQLSLAVYAMEVGIESAASRIQRFRSMVFPTVNIGGW